MKEKNKVCSYKHGTSLNSKLRHKLQNPSIFLKPFVKQGMNVLDYGCGGGFCTFDIASILNGKGQVVAADLQQEMLDIIQQRMEQSSFQKVIKLHQCKSDEIGLTESFDFILLFYMFHEITNKKKILTELVSILKEDGVILLSEPYYHVNRAEYDKEVDVAKQCGLSIKKGPRIFFSRTRIMTIIKS